jgi:hypothetical protein
MVIGIIFRRDTMSNLWLERGKTDLAKELQIPYESSGTGIIIGFTAPPAHMHARHLSLRLLWHAAPTFQPS